MVMASFAFAALLKLYNDNYLLLLDIHVEAQRKKIKVQDAIKQRYFKFYTEVLPRSEHCVSMFRLFNVTYPRDYAFQARKVIG